MLNMYIKPGDIVDVRFISKFSGLYQVAEIEDDLLVCYIAKRNYDYGDKANYVTTSNLTVLLMSACEEILVVHTGAAPNQPYR